MSRKPTHKNIPQAVLHQIGTNRVGVDAANVMDDKEVRKAGVKQIAKRVGQVAAVGVGVATLGVGFNYAVDHSPTVRYQEQLQHNGSDTPQSQADAAPQQPAEQHPVPNETPHK